MRKSLIVNGKFNKQRTTGVQRYAIGILSNLKDCQSTCPSSQNRLIQILWEQLWLPMTVKFKNALLVNFCNTAPFWYKNQIVAIHDMAVFENPTWFQPTFAKYYHWLFKKLAKNANHFVTVSEFSKQEMVKHLELSPEKITVIHSAISPNWEHIESEAIDSLNGQKFLLMVGSRDPRKNFDFVIEQLANWLQVNNYKLIIAGNTGKAFSSSSAVESNNVSWLANLNDHQLKWLYENTALLIHPSLYEGFSLVPLEGISLKVNCLISNIPVHREIVGDRAHYFELNNSTSLIEKLNAALANPFIQGEPLPYSFEKSADRWKKIMNKYF